MFGRVIIRAKILNGNDSCNNLYHRKDKRMEKRELTLNIRETKEQARRRVYKSNQLEKRISLLRKLSIGAATVGLAAGIIGGPIISNMAKEMRNTKDTKAAIQMAADSEAYLASIKSNPIMSEVVSLEDLDRLEELTNAINTYNKLKNKTDPTFNEQEAYLEACNTIGNAKQLVTNNYNAIIKKKIAEAYGIKDPHQVSQIGVYSYEEVEGQELYRITEIDLPDGRKVINADATLPDNKIDRKLIKQIEKANELDEYHFSKDGKIPTEVLDKIIENLTSAQEFNARYGLVAKKEGTRIEVDDRSKSQEIDY